MEGRLVLFEFRCIAGPIRLGAAPTAFRGVQPALLPQPITAPGPAAGPTGLRTRTHFGADQAVALPRLLKVRVAKPSLVLITRAPDHLGLDSGPQGLTTVRRGIGCSLGACLLPMLPSTRPKQARRRFLLLPERSAPQLRILIIDFFQRIPRCFHDFIIRV